MVIWLFTSTQTCVFLKSCALTDWNRKTFFPYKNKRSFFQKWSFELFFSYPNNNLVVIIRLSSTLITLHNNAVLVVNGNGSNSTHDCNIQFVLVVCRKTNRFEFTGTTIVKVHVTTSSVSYADEYLASQYYFSQSYKHFRRHLTWW